MEHARSTHLNAADGPIEVIRLCLRGRVLKKAAAQCTLRDASVGTFTSAPRALSLPSSHFPSRRLNPASLIPRCSDMKPNKTAVRLSSRALNRSQHSPSIRHPWNKVRRDILVAGMHGRILT